MTNLSNKTCEVCRVGAPQVTQKEIDSFKPLIPGWKITTVEDVNHLIRVFKFNNFIEAIAFTNKIGDLAESEGHHPAILTEWGSVKVSWWTHKINGLHVNDFIMAAKTDELLK
ncbi:MAG: 4a-hydroxytetrahydrobiopterin dehydratase [Bacteroidetes bacterium]|nr:4a-hydroxytetrahydrobiopterin dehydratase [Bacteroidota bacterium]